MIFDTDILIWIERGSAKAAKFVEKQSDRFISIQTYMELFQCAKTKQHQTVTRSFLHDFEFNIIPFSENIGHRAAIYVEEFSLSHGIRAGDAIIAATAVEKNLPLASGNKKHFSMIPGLSFKQFIAHA